MKTVELVCSYEECQKTFRRNVHKTKNNPSGRYYCSSECTRLGQIRATGRAFSKSGPYTGVHVCPICDEKFTPHHPSVVYCSDECKWKRRNERTKQAYKDRAVVGHQYVGKAKSQYKLTMLETQTECGICRRDLTALEVRDVHLDHCHTSGKIRGLLCFKCNAGLGQMDDSIERLHQAIKYLEQFKD